LPPSLDDEFELAERSVTTFNDLGPGVLSEERDPTAIGSDGDPVIQLSTAQPGPVAEPEIESTAQPEPESDSTPVAQPELSLAAEPVPEPDDESVADPRS
jgi:hypothetical protein